MAGVMSGWMSGAVEAPAGEGRRRRRILFVAEAVTLCHVARPVVLARALDPALYDVHLACAPRYEALFRGRSFPLHRIQSISNESFLAALARGKPLYDAATLRAYVREDLELLARVQPEVVVGDMRLSLSVSARLAGIPYMTITNAHWSPYARPYFPVPELIHTKRMGPRLAQAVFSLLRPLLFAHHALPLNRVRREHGLPPLRPSLSGVFTDADDALYADLPDVVPTFKRPPHHHYVGPILWSHETEIPSWWDEVPRDRPMVYVTLGSSGRSDLLPLVLDALSRLPVVAVAATTARMRLPQTPRNAWVTDYLPADQAAGRSALVICNGGSATAYSALATGVPVLGLPSNLDQYLTMFYLRKTGAAGFIRAGEATVSVIAQAVAAMLQSSAPRRCAESLQARIMDSRMEGRFMDVLAARLGGAAPSRAAPPAPVQ